MKKIEVPLKNNSYNIYIENGLLSNISHFIKQVYNHQKIYIITDVRVEKLYMKCVLDSLSGYDVNVISIVGYEKSKSLETYKNVVSELINKGIRREHLIIALGGGVVGDLAGFIAGTLYRGVKYIQIPTTLLAQNDSSIGGKTGIDIDEGKNLLGVFYQPLMVLIDPNCLKTLNKKEYSNGLAEMIKHGLIGDKTIIDRLKKNINIDEDIIYDSINVKKKFVIKDELDTNVRMILNFGHTFGHAIEKKYKYEKFTHGEAISIGMLMALDMGEKLGITKKGLFDDVKELLTKCNLPNYVFDKKEYLELIKNDKKNMAGVLNFIFIKDIEDPVIYQIDEEKIKDVT